MSQREVFPGVISFDDGRVLTKNLAPGTRVYDEELYTVDGAEWRTWNPTRSKLGAYILKGGRHFPLRNDSKVLYLGAANGTTPSHVSDVVSDGVLVAVEFSPRSFRDLLRVSGKRPNMVPVLADAWRPELYERYLGRVDFLFQDIAQRQQAAIFAKNVNRFKPQWAMLAIKARSVDVAANPRDVYDTVAAQVAEMTGYEVVEMVDLGPFEKDHAAIVIKAAPAGSAKPAARQEQRSAERERPREYQREERRDDRPPQREERRGFQPRGPPSGGYGGGGGAPSGPRGYDKRDRPGGFNRDQPRGGGGGGGGWQQRPPRGDAPPSDAPRDNRPPRDAPRDDRPPRDDKPSGDDFGKRRKWR